MGQKRFFALQPRRPRQGAGSICRLDFTLLEETNMKLHTGTKLVSLAAAAALTLSLAACSGPAASPMPAGGDTPPPESPPPSTRWASATTWTTPP